MGLPAIAFKLGLLRVAVILPLLLPMIHKFGLAGAAIAVTAGIACQWLCGLYFLHKHIGIVPNHLAKVFWRPTWTSTGMVLAVIGLMHVVDAHSVFGLLTVVAGGVVVFVLPNVPVIRELKRQGLR
jgi:O-antigen/teichoic acid export membrane protein